jgi:hypothetical protein
VSKHLLPVGLACLVSFTGLSGCAPAPGGSAGGPRVAPVAAGKARGTPQGGDVATGAGTLEAIRRQLEGKWELTSLQVIDAGGKAVPVAATGRMAYDAYGNLDLDVEITDAATLKALEPRNTNWDLKGRAVIDAAKSSLRVQDAVSTGGGAAPDNIERIRFYEFKGDTLTLTAKDASGKTTGVTAWKRAS